MADRGGKPIRFWGYFFTTMSFRKGCAYWDDMGLKISDSTAKELRRLTVRAMPEFFGDAKTINDLEKRVDNHRNIVQNYLENVAAQLKIIDDVDAAVALKWITCTFMGGGNTDYEELWEDVIYNLHRKLNEDRYENVVMNTDAEKINDKLDRFLQERRRIRKRLKDIRNESRSDEDVEILSYYGSSDVWGDVILPYDIIDTTCCCAVFRKLWSGLWEEGDKESMAFLYEYFRSFAREMRIESANPSLIHPPVMESW